MRAAAEKGITLPPSFYERGELRSDLLDIWNAFFLLSRFRGVDSLNGKYLPLRIADLIAFLQRGRRRQVEEVDLDLKLLAALDATYLGIVNKG